MNEGAEPLTRVMALHALAYCERLFYLEEVEEIRLADEAVFAGRALHEEISAPDLTGTEYRNFALASPSLGLIGQVDAVRQREGSWVPYEHKRGRCRREPDGTAGAWPSDRLQVIAYALLLEEFLGEPVPEARIRYHRDNVTVRVSIDEAARADLARAQARSDVLRSQVERPPVTDNPSLCVHCSLAPVCLPEEERLAADPDWRPLRLFPAEAEGQVLHVVTQGSRVGRSGLSLTVASEDGPDRQKLPIHEVASVVLHGNTQITTQAIHLCAAHGVAIHWMTGGGRYLGGFVAGAGGVQRRVRQHQALSDPALRLHLARRLAMARVEGQIRYLLRATRGRAQRPPHMKLAIDSMRSELKALPRAEGIDSVRGHEGRAARWYFDCLADLILEPDSALRPAGRNRRPPQDRFNALLSFGYGLLYRSVLEALLSVGLEPALGFFHTPRSAAHPLALDVMELFRVPLWDMPVIASINRRHWDAKADFAVARDHVWLSEHGRRKAIELYESRLAEGWKHPVTGYSLSYSRSIELEVRLLEKEWSGEPGLFARSRLR